MALLDSDGDAWYSTDDSTSSDGSTSDGSNFGPGSVNLDPTPDNDPDLIPDSLTDIGAGWLTGLKGNIDTLVNFATNPTGFIIGTLLVWLVGGVLGFLEAAVALILRAFELAAQGITTPFTTVMGILGGVGSWFLSMAGTVGGAVVGFFVSLGWMSPILLALLFVALLEWGETFIGPLANSVSDLLGAIPVVGSILDFVLTFAVGVLRNIYGGLT